MRDKWKEEQFVEISASELFVWWDWLDSFEDTPEKAFGLFTHFLEECEDQLYCTSDFYKSKKENDIFDEIKKDDIPFVPRHVF